MDNIEIKTDDIKEICEKHGTNMDSVLMDIRREFNLRRLAGGGGCEKRSGVSVAALFETAALMPLFVAGSVKSFFEGCLRKIAEGSDCAFYRFSQSSRFNWRGALAGVSKHIGALERKNNLEAKYPRALILDDTIEKKAGRRIEGVSMVHDHVSGRSVPGYKLLGLAWFNGRFTRVVDFSLVAEKKIRLKKGGQFRKERAPGSAGGKRKKELRKDKITLACELLGRAGRAGYAAAYVLTDTWFTCARLINKVRGLRGGLTHFLGMVKPDKRIYTYNNKPYTLSQLRGAVMAKKKRCRRFRSAYAEVVCELKNVGRVKLFFSRFRSNKKWVCLLTTDLGLTYTKAVETYGIRWSIEVLFKECKQLLGLGKCQANDFDAQIAHATCVFIAHAALAHFKFRESYQTLGALYAAIEAQHTGLLAVERILIMLEEILTSVASKMGGLASASLHDVLSAPEYAAFKRAIRSSLFLDEKGISPKPSDSKSNAPQKNMRAA